MVPILEHIVQAGDVGVSERRRGARFTHQAPTRDWRIEPLARQALHRDLTPETYVLGQEYLSHAAVPELTDHQVRPVCFSRRQ